MKIGKWASVLLAVAPLLQGCKGFWDAPTTGTGTGATGGIFYVLNQKTSQIAGYSIVDGTVTSVTSSPFALGAAPLAAAISPNNGYLYVSTAAGIYMYTIGSDGALTVGAGGDILSSDVPFTMQVDPSGSWLIEAVSGTGEVFAIPLDSTTGLVDTTAQEQSRTLPSLGLQQLVVSPGSSSFPYVFVAMGNGGTAVIPFTATATNPFGTTVSTVATKSGAGGANAIAVDPSNRLLYVGETVASSGTQTGGLRVFTISSASKLTEVSGSPYPTGGTGPSSILATASYIYVSNRAVSGAAAGNISGFAVNTSGTTFSLAAINTVPAGTATVGLAEENTSNYLLAVNSGGSPDLSAYTFDTTTTGQLDAATTSSTGTDPVTAVAIVAEH